MVGSTAVDVLGADVLGADVLGFDVLGVEVVLVREVVDGDVVGGTAVVELAALDEVNAGVVVVLVGLPAAVEGPGERCRTIIASPVRRAAARTVERSRVERPIAFNRARTATTVGATPAPCPPPALLPCTPR